MAVPMLLPIVPLLKILALGSLKLVFLAIGAGFFPIYTLRTIVGGASGMLMPALTWLLENNRLQPEQHERICADLAVLSEVEFSRAEARQVLWKVIRKTVDNMLGALFGLPGAVVRFFGRFGNNKESG